MECVFLKLKNHSTASSLKRDSMRFVTLSTPSTTNAIKYTIPPALKNNN